MDLAVAAAYGWEDMAMEHGFYEVDYLPENDRVRYTISPGTWKEVIVWLHGLNREYHEEELAAGLVDSKAKPLKRARSRKKKGAGDDELYDGTLL
jgi:hypothetical protein